MPKSSPASLDFNKSYLIKLTLIITLSNFVMGYEIGTCNTTEKHISKYISWPGYEYIYIAISSTLLCLGASIGSLLTGKLANYYGRRKIIIINNVFMLVFVFIRIIEQRYLFLAMRFMIGICMGVCSTVVPIFLNEICPKEIIGFLGIFIQIMISLGILVSFLLANIFDELFDGFTLWSCLLMVPAIPLCVQSFLFLVFFKFDTPKWLFFKARGQEMEMVLRKIYKPWAWQSKMRQLYKETGSNKNTQEILPVLLSQSMSKPMFLVYFLCAMQQFSGINLSIFYSSSTVQSFSLNQQASLLTTIIGIVNFLAVLPTLKLITHLGCKKMLLQGLIGMCLSYIIFAFLGYFSDSEISAWFRYFMILISVISFETSLGTVLWVYITEVSAVRWIGSAVSIHWLCAAIIALTLPFILKSNSVLSLYTLYSFFAFMCFLGFFVVRHNAIDTKKVSIEQFFIQLARDKELNSEYN